MAAAEKAVKIVVLQYQKGAVDFNRYAVIEQNLVTQQDSAAQARGQIAQGLIATYRALGGGWEIRLGGGPAAAETPEMRRRGGRIPRKKSPRRCPPLPAVPRNLPCRRPAPSPPMDEEVPWPADKP